MLNKLTTFLGSALAAAFLIGLATTLTRSSMIGFLGCAASIYFNGNSNFYDGLRSFLRQKIILNNFEQFKK